MEKSNKGNNFTVTGIVIKHTKQSGVPNVHQTMIALVDPLNIRGVSPTYVCCVGEFVPEPNISFLEVCQLDVIPLGSFLLDAFHHFRIRSILFQVPCDTTKNVL